VTKPELDDLDRKILDRYQHDTRTPAGAIGKAIGLSAAAVQRRIKRMRGDGVIVAEVAAIAPERVGYGLTCLVGVRLMRESAAEGRSFKAKMLRHRRVQQCYSVTGDVDYMLIVLSRDVRDFEAFAQATLNGDDNVRSFTTFVVLDRVKVTTATPIEP
jgi:Lrp/AsnC family leucine-responsive transcriptional regulator